MTVSQWRVGRADRSTGSAPRPHPERSYPQGATTLQGETLFQQPDRRMHRTGLAYTSLHRFRARAIFYPNFYPKEQQSGAGMLYVLVIVANWSGRPGCVTDLPSRSCGSDSRRPLQFINNFRFGVPICPVGGRLLGRKSAHAIFLQPNWNTRT